MIECTWIYPTAFNTAISKHVACPYAKHPSCTSCNIFYGIHRPAPVFQRQKTFMEDLKSVFIFKANIEALGLSREAHVKVGCKFYPPLNLL